MIILEALPDRLAALAELAAEISQPPKMHLADWYIVGVADPDCRTLHGYGRRSDSGTWRVTSPIVRWDAERRVFRTASGSIYGLRGPPGDCEDPWLPARLRGILCSWQHTMH